MKAGRDRIARSVVRATQVGRTTLRILPHVGWVIVFVSILPLGLFSLAVFAAVFRSVVPPGYKAAGSITWNAVVAMKFFLPCAVAVLIAVLCSVGWWRNRSSRLIHEPVEENSPNVKPKRVIGVLLVHGIGLQERGSTTRSFVQGLKRSANTRILDDSCDSNARVLTTEHTLIRIYEVFWADYLTGSRVKDTFKPLEVQSLAVFPLLNRRAGLYRHAEYRTAWLWTSILAPLSALIFVFYPLIFLPRVRKMLDENAGDVFNYVNSAGRVLPPTDPLANVADQVVNEFYKTILQASEDGCSELRVIAHSLGTLVTYHAMGGYLLDRPLEDSELRYTRDSLPLDLVRRVYTIGSPLNKVRSIWPRLIPLADYSDATLVRGAEAASDRRIKDKRGDSSVIWYNYYDVLDVVASRLRDFDGSARIRNHALFFWGGLYKAHTVYTQSGVSHSGVQRSFRNRGTGCPDQRTPPRMYISWIFLPSAGAGIGCLHSNSSLACVRRTLCSHFRNSRSNWTPG